MLIDRTIGDTGQGKGELIVEVCIDHIIATVRRERTTRLNNQLECFRYLHNGRDKLHAKFTFFAVDANETFQIDCANNGKSEFCM